MEVEGSAGILSVLSINEKESKALLDYLRKNNQTPAFDFVKYLIGERYIQFLDLLAGTTLKVPNHKNLFRDVEYVKIYCYVRDRGYTIESVRNAAKIYNKNLAFVKRAVAKISEAIEGQAVVLVNIEGVDDLVDDSEEGNGYEE